MSILLRLERQIKELESDHQETLSALRAQHKSDLAALEQVNAAHEAQQSELQKEVCRCMQRYEMSGRHSLYSEYAHVCISIHGVRSDKAAVAV